MNARYIVGGIAVIVALSFITKLRQARQMLSRLGKHWSNLHPGVQEAALNVIDELAHKGIFVAIPRTGGWREIEGQAALMGTGVTRVNEALNSYHTWGLAVDFVPLDAAGKFYWPPKADPIWTEIGNAIKKHGGEWGGDWTSFFDGPHAQFPQYGRIAELRANYGTPGNYLQRGIG